MAETLIIGFLVSLLANAVWHMIVKWLDRK